MDKRLGRTLPGLFWWPITVQMSGETAQARPGHPAFGRSVASGRTAGGQGEAGCVSCPGPSPHRPEDTSVRSKAPRAPRKRDVPAQGPWARGAGRLAAGPPPSAPAPSVPQACRLAPSHARDLCFGRGWPPLPSQGPFPRRCPRCGLAAPAACVLGGSGVGGAPWPLPMRGQKHCPRRDSRAPLRTHRACPAGRPAQVSIAIPPGPELLPGHMLLVPRLAVTRVFVGGWVPDPRSWLIGRRNCSGRWPGLSLH